MANQPLTALKLVRLAEFVSPDEWIRPLNDWNPPPMPEPDSNSDGKGKAWQMAEQEREHAEVQFDSLVSCSAADATASTGHMQKPQCRGAGMRIADSGAAEFLPLDNVCGTCGAGPSPAAPVR